MGLVEIINEEVGTHPQEKLSVGKIVKAMINPVKNGKWSFEVVGWGV